MGDDRSAGNGVETGSVSFAFGERLLAHQFDTVFKDGMALVERTASYLDGAGRAESKGLPPTVTVLYATESMRLTARLLDIASWLLIRRALRDGEISEAEARVKRQRLKLQALGRPSHTRGFDQLPVRLQALVTDSHDMLRRILQLDRTGLAGVAAEPPRETGRVAHGPPGEVVRLHDIPRRRPRGTV